MPPGAEERSQHMASSVDLAAVEPDEAAVAKIPAQYAFERLVLPVRIIKGRLTVAFGADGRAPGDGPAQIAEELRFLTGLAIDLIPARTEAVRRAIDRCYLGKMLRDASQQEIEVLKAEEEDIADLERLAGEAFTVKFVNLLFQQAVQARASDIHLEPFERDLKVRFRIDGVLHEAPSPQKRLQAAITSRIKIMAGLNIAERRLPQDGRIKLRVSTREIDVRVSTVPTVYGESVVMRLLDRVAMLKSLEDLGMDGGTLAAYTGLIQRPYGILLVTGPTGSGKTTSLYASLAKLYSTEKKIITIEDPVEYQIEGINQIPVRPKIGLDFAHGLRSILRQDPDIVMIGEIRDLETAEIAIQASLTGHLVLSTIHTNDAASTITRLLDMGIDPYLVASSVFAILAQRLVRRVCPHCREEYVPGEEHLRWLGESEAARVLTRGRGCRECRETGYLGRLGIFELLTVDRAVKDLILRRASADEIRQAGLEAGMVTLRRDGVRKALDGLTTLEEVARVTALDVETGATVAGTPANSEMRNPAGLWPGSAQRRHGETL
ncbi:MAG: type II secretion system ATPase GspE [Bacteroidota bacterium]